MFNSGYFLIAMMTQMETEMIRLSFELPHFYNSKEVVEKKNIPEVSEFGLE